MNVISFLKKQLDKYSSILLIVLSYILGYLIAYPHIARSFIYFYSLGNVLIDLFERFLIFLSFLFLIGVLFKYLRFLSYLLILVLSLYIRSVFKKDFDTGLALSFLSTNTSEAIEVFKDIIILSFFIDGKMNFSNTKGQTNVPLYIWYSHKLKNNNLKLGVVNQLTQKKIVHSLVLNLLGIFDRKENNLKYTNKIRFVNSDLTVSNYKDLIEN